MLWAGVFAFGLQIYADFSAYSDIARGAARWFGFELIVNFNHPYIAHSPTDFWRRWHISLSTWFRDYVYIPLGGNRVPRAAARDQPDGDVPDLGVLARRELEFRACGGFITALLVARDAQPRAAAAVAGAVARSAMRSCRSPARSC